MRNFVTIVFDNSEKAYQGLHSLWALDDVGEITVHGTAVVHRDDAGRFEVCQIGNSGGSSGRQPARVNGGGRLNAALLQPILQFVAVGDEDYVEVIDRFCLRQHGRHRQLGHARERRVVPARHFPPWG